MGEISFVYNTQQVSLTILGFHSRNNSLVCRIANKPFLLVFLLLFLYPFLFLFFFICRESPPLRPVGLLRGTKGDALLYLSTWRSLMNWAYNKEV